MPYVRTYQRRDGTIVTGHYRGYSNGNLLYRSNYYVDTYRATINTYTKESSLCGSSQTVKDKYLKNLSRLELENINRQNMKLNSYTDTLINESRHLKEEVIFEDKELKKLYSLKIEELYQNFLEVKNEIEILIEEIEKLIVEFDKTRENNDENQYIYLHKMYSGDNLKKKLEEKKIIKYKAIDNKEASCIAKVKYRANRWTGEFERLNNIWLKINNEVFDYIFLNSDQLEREEIIEGFFQQRDEEKEKYRQRWEGISSDSYIKKALIKIDVEYEEKLKQLQGQIKG